MAWRPKQTCSPYTCSPFIYSVEYLSETMAKKFMTNPCTCLSIKHVPVKISLSSTTASSFLYDLTRLSRHKHCMALDQKTRGTTEYLHPIGWFCCSFAYLNNIQIQQIKSTFKNTVAELGFFLLCSRKLDGSNKGKLKIFITCETAKKTKVYYSHFRHLCHASKLLNRISLNEHFHRLPRKSNNCYPAYPLIMCVLMLILWQAKLKTTVFIIQLYHIKIILILIIFKHHLSSVDRNVFLLHHTN